MKSVAAMLLILLFLIGVSQGMAAPLFYLAPDSGIRVLSESDLWKWDYDALDYVYHEILARHGYSFESGSIYEAYFSEMEWYQKSELDHDSILESLSKIELENMVNIREVRKQMRPGKTKNEKGSSVHEIIEFMNAVSPYSGFQPVHLGKHPPLPVYSGPGEEYPREGDGKAAVSTEGPIFCAGYVGDWLLIMYETNSGEMRFGYISYPHETLGVSEIVFDHTIASIVEECVMTDTFQSGKTQLATFKKGTDVTFLCYMDGEEKWAYIETTKNNVPMRGFVPFEAIQLFYPGEIVFIPYFQRSETEVIILSYHGTKKDIVFPDHIDGKTVVEIGQSAMGASSYYPEMIAESVYIPYGVRVIGENAFAFCKNLRSVHLPSSLVRIDSCAFFSCSSLSDISLPGHLSFIRSAAFAHCRSLSDIKMPSFNLEIADNAFTGTRIRMIVSPHSSAEEYAKAHGIPYIYYKDYNNQQKSAK